MEAQERAEQIRELRERKLLLTGAIGHAAALIIQSKKLIAESRAAIKFIDKELNELGVNTDI